METPKLHKRIWVSRCFVLGASTRINA